MDGESVLRAGYRLERFELLCPIASGGMASVWLARLRGKRDFEKLYAIKTIKTELGDDPRFQEMFLDEARLASQIEHPNVAHILDLGEQDGILYIVMELVDGEALAKIERQARKVATPVPIGLSLRIIADACAGLHAAHELKDRSGQTLGVIHRDVSPQNILIATNGAVKVIDFGVAKARNRRAGETGEGIVKGKIRFMAPEQVRAQELDRRVDIWAVGVCLHELATGRLPFDSDSDIDVVRRLISDEPPPAFKDVPGPIAEILSHSLVRDPGERFATAAAMRRAIENAMVEMRVPATSEDIADFVRSNLPEFAEKRHAVIAKAMQEADKRPPSASLVSASEVDVSGPTIISKPHPIPLVDSATPGPRSVSARALLSGRDETVGGAFTDEEMAAIPKRRAGLWWLVTIAALSAAAWVGWPGGPRIKAFVRHVTAASAAPTTDVPPTSTPSASAPTPSATPSSSLTTSASASAQPIPATVDASTPVHIHHQSNDVTFTAGPSDTATATATATAAVTATATATATVTATATATATATDTAPEQNAPY